ncbi:MAG: HEAT repeat domain-containing protein [Pirellulales bacterium]
MRRIFGSQPDWSGFLLAAIAVIALSLGQAGLSPARESKPGTNQEDESADGAGAETDDPFGAGDDPFGAETEDEEKEDDAPHPAPAKGLSVDDCIHELDGSDHHGRWRAARRLRDLGPRAKQAIPALVAVLEDDDADVASMAAEALGAVGAATDVVVPSLAEALAHPDWVVRWSAAGALARIGPDARAADKALIRVINSDKDRDVKQQASRALARIKGKARKLTAE